MSGSAAKMESVGGLVECLFKKDQLVQSGFLSGKVNDKRTSLTRVPPKLCVTKIMGRCMKSKLLVLDLVGRVREVPTS